MVKYTYRNYLLTAGCVGTIIFVLFSVLPNVNSIAVYATDPALPLVRAWSIITSLLLESMRDNIVAYPFTLVFSAAAGLNVPLLWHFMRTYRPGIPLRGLPASMFGFIASIMGIGCAACGAVFFGALSASVSGAVLALPLQGSWLGYLGICLLIFSSWYLARTINRFERE